MTDEGPRPMLDFPQDGGELLDALRLAEALERVEAGHPSGVDPIEDPALAGLVDTAARLSLELDAASAGHAFRSFRTRSRAAVLHALEDGATLQGARSGSVPSPFMGEGEGGGRITPIRRPLYRHPAIVGPFAAVAAAASLVFAVLSGGPLPSMPGPDGTDGTGATATNMTPRSTDEELDRLAVVIADIQHRKQSGQPVPAPLLREVSEGTARVANTIEQRPEQVSKETVTAYIAQAQTGQTVLTNVTVEQDAQGALAVAQRTAKDGAVVAARFLSAATATATTTPEPTPTATPAPTSTATRTPAPTSTATPSATPAPTATPTPSATASPIPTATTTPEPTPDPTPSPTAAPTATPTPDPANDIVR